MNESKLDFIRRDRSMMRSSSSCSRHANSVHLLAEEDLRHYYSQHHRHEAPSSSSSATARSEYRNENSSSANKNNASSDYSPSGYSRTNEKKYGGGGIPAHLQLLQDLPKSRPAHLSDVDLMKERFATLLLGEDMSGGAKGVSSALAISNAITDLAESVFGGMWRLQPLAAEKKAMWKREMEWLLAVADHVVELVPAWQSNPAAAAADGSSTGDVLLEVMVSRPRSDLDANLPALRKLDAMLVESLEKFGAPNEFWYADREEEEVHGCSAAVGAGDGDGKYKYDGRRRRRRRQLLLRRRREEVEKRWLPSTPRVPLAGLSDETVKRLEAQRECIRQILKAALSINNQALSDMEVPRSYWERLGKTGRECLGEELYKRVTSPAFSVEATVEEEAEVGIIMEAMDRAEAAIHVWRRMRRRHHYRRRRKASYYYGSSGSSSSVLCQDDDDGDDQNQNENHHPHNRDDMSLTMSTQNNRCRSRSRLDAAAAAAAMASRSWSLLVCDFFFVFLRPPPDDDDDDADILASRVESLVFAIRHRFPTLPRSLLHRFKIHHNKDVGQSILESYSRALQRLAATIISRIDHLLLLHSTTKRSITQNEDAVVVPTTCT